MLSFLHSYFTHIHNSFVAVFNYMYRDVLDKKSSPTPSKLKKIAKGEAKIEGDGKKFERQSSHGRGVEEREGIKVKILMTKEEVKQFLSKCKDGGVLEFKDVAHQLIQIPTSRVSIVSSSTCSDRGLESITEEF
ncbi:hypothetical protein ACSBR2_038215 [Camellia fascicularis]